jgi:ParB-like chromosome segregation protein Spo0J
MEDEKADLEFEPQARESGGMTEMLISAIIIGQRHRRDMGDIAALAASIEAVGLLHFPVVDKHNVLVAGERRIRAALSLGWTQIPVNVIDIAEIVHGESAENEVRKDFTHSEAVAIKRLVEPLIAAEAKTRQAAAGPATGRGKKATSGAKLASTVRGKTRDLVAKRTGKSRTTLAKAEQVVEAAEAEPNKFAALAEEMDRTGKVDGPFKQLKASKMSPADEDKEDRPQAPSHAKAQQRNNTITTAPQLAGVIKMIGRIDIGFAARMSSEERIDVLAQIARADAWLNKIAITVAGSNANLGILAPVSLLVPALEFLKAAVLRVETALDRPGTP